MKRLIVALAGVALAVGSLVLLRGTPLGARVAWRQQVSPGALSTAHAFLRTDCAACHTPVQGVQAVKCVACHATNEELLARQPSAFHASVQSCRGCHVEHQGADTRPTRMDHAALASIGLRALGSADTVGADADRRKARDYLAAWMRAHDASQPARGAHPEVTAAESTLDCASCHANKDPHFKLLGRDCASCHATAQWTIPAFVHPSPRSTSCAQCHQAPPSHYMMHFEMMDKPIVAQGGAGVGGACCANVQVNQCYRCHQTDAWNSIKGVGFFKLH